MLMTFCNLSIITSLCYDGDGDSPGGDSPGGDSPGGDSPDGESSGEFSIDSWDGKEESLPEDKRALFKAFQEKTKTSREQAASEELRRTLVRNLEDRWRKNQPAPRQLTKEQNEEPLTREAIDNLLRERTADEQRRQRIADFRSGMTEIVGGINQFGSASIAFSSKEEVDEFEGFMQKKFNEGITPREFLMLHRFEAILKQHGEAAVREMEKKLGGRRGDLGKGGRFDRNAPPAPKDPPVGSGRVPSIEEMLKREHPEEYRKIMKGEINPVTGEKIG